MPGGPADPSLSWADVSGPSAKYRLLTRKVSFASAAALMALWQRFTDGDLTEDDLATLGATSLQSANEHSATLADLYLAHLLRVEPLGLAAPADAGRLHQAVSTAASEQGTNPADALDRLGRAEPLQTGQKLLTDGMKKHGVSGWTRKTGGSPCQMCADLADGTVLSPDTEMLSHAGCSCVPEPVEG
jgi:hypothetical protein